MKKRRLLAPLVVCACGLLLSAPLLLYGAPTGGDALFHAMWHRNFSAQLAAGDLYPRWLLQMNGGLGSPAFFFYAPLPYYVAAIFTLFLPAGAYGLLHVGASLSLSLVASGLIAYLWLKETTNQAAAACAAIIYMLAPYHLGTDVYTRVALAEVWAFVWMPLALYFVRRLEAGSTRLALAGLALGYAALILTHLPTTLIFSLVPPCYAFFVCAPPRRRTRVALATIGGMSLGLGLAAVYLVPALTTQAFVSLGDLLPELYHQRWLQLTNINPDEFDGRITVAALTTLGLVACAAVLARSTGDDEATQHRFKPERLFWIVVSLGCLLLMTPVSGMVWRIVKPLQTIQFPWRFNAVLCVAVAALVAHAAARTFRRRPPLGALDVAALALAVALVLYWLCFNYSLARQAHPALRGDTAARLDAEFVKRQEQMRDAPEYRPATAASTQAVAFDELMARICRAGDRPAQVCVVAGAGEVAVDSWRPREIELSVTTANGVALNVSQFHYPGWAAYLDGQRHPLAPSQPDGLLHLSVPAGAHRIKLRLRHTAAEDAGIVVSAASLVLLFAWLAAPKPGRRKK